MIARCRSSLRHVARSRSGIRAPFACARGASLVEYSLIAGLVSLAAILSVSALGGEVRRVFLKEAYEASVVMGRDNFLANGDFEDLAGGTPTAWGASLSTLPGWRSPSGLPFELHRNGWEGMTSPSGESWLDMGGSPGNLSIEQDATGLVEGGLYAVSFIAGDRANDLSNRVEVWFGGELVGVVDPDEADVMKPYSFVVTAGQGDGSDTIRIVETGQLDSVGVALDELRIFGAPR